MHHSFNFETSLCQRVLKLYFLDFERNTDKKFKKINKCDINAIVFDKKKKKPFS